MMTLDRVAELTDVERESIRLLSQAVYPAEVLADWPGRELEWSEPERCVRFRDAAGTLISYIGVYVRPAEWESRPARVGGVGNVKTLAAARGRGFARMGIDRAVEYFREQAAVAFALLVCEPHLIGYYARLGWREYSGRLVVRQHGAAADFTLCPVMTIGVGTQAPTAGTIDLCGPPW